MSVSECNALRMVPLNLDYLRDILRIEHEAYPDPWTQGMFRQEMHNGTSHFYLGFQDDALVAYGGFWLVLDEAHITKVTVAADHRGRGLGGELMQFLERRATRLGATSMRLEVREQNQVARRLYTNLGFRAVGLRHGYYAKTNETAVVMMRNLARD